MNEICECLENAFDLETTPYIKDLCRVCFISNFHRAVVVLRRGRMKIFLEREWSMPNSKTFQIGPIRSLILEEQKVGLVIDPFAGSTSIEQLLNPQSVYISNDLDPNCITSYHLDALDFLKSIESDSVDMVLYDPPYSPRQVSECYKRFDRTVNMETTQASYWSNQKKEISRVLRVGGKCITCGWNSGGIGKKYGFSINRILLVAHGGWHNDTICTVETKEKMFQGEEE